MEKIDSMEIEKIEIEFTDEEVKEIEKAREMPITFDEDCPSTTPEKALKYKRVNPKNLAIG